MTLDDADLALVRLAFDDFDELNQYSLDEVFHSVNSTPDGAVEFVDGFPASGRYEGVEGDRRRSAGRLHGLNDDSILMLP